MRNTEAADKARDFYAGLLAYLRDVKTDIRARRPADMESAYRLVRTLVDEPDLIQSIFPLTLKDNLEEDYMVTHQANVAVCAMKLGIVLEYKATHLLDLGVASLIHDLGLWNAPDAVLNKKDRLTEAEHNLIRDHSRIGRDILARCEPEHPRLSEVIYQHHERGNGTGYPRGLKMQDIHRDAILICFVDAYEAMTHCRPHRRALKQTLTTAELMAGFKESAFPSAVIRAFLNEITPYPEGCYVLLNNQWVCEVVAVNRDNPLRPDIRVVKDHLGRKDGVDRVIRLIDNPIYHIEDCISPHEIGDD